MAQLRAKQIKLSAANDLLIGGTGGNGTVLTMPTTAGDAFKVLTINAGRTAIEYATVDGANVSFTPAGNISATTVAGALGELDSEKLALAGGTMTGNIVLGANKITTSATTFASDELVTKTYVDNMVAGGVRYMGEVDASAVDEEEAGVNLPAQNGDLYRVATAGSSAFGMQLNVGDYVIYNGTGWDRIDAVDATVSGTTDRITVTGSEDTGYVVDIASNYAGQASIVTLGTVTSGTWNGTTIAVANGGTGATDAATARENLGLEIGVDVQAYSSTLDSLAAFDTDGILVQTDTGSFTGRSVVASSTAGLEGISLTNGSGVAGNITVGLNINGLSANGSIAGTEEVAVYNTTSNAKVTVQAIAEFAADQVSQSFLDLTDTDDTAVANGFVRWNGAGDTLVYETTIDYSVLTGTPSQGRDVLAYADATVSSGDATLVDFFTQNPESGTLQVFFNGLALMNGFSVDGADLVLDIDTVGYALEAGDEIVASYTYFGGVV